MRIAIVAPGSRGDVQPYLALGVGLTRAGHGVRLVTTLDFAELVRAHGVPAVVADVDVQAALGAVRARSAIEGGGRLASFRALADIARGATRALFDAGMEAARDADLILGGFGGLLVGLSLAEKLGRPFLQAYNVPITPTASFAGALFPHLPSWTGAWAHRLSHRLTRQFLWQTARAAGNEARVELLGLPPLPFAGPFERAPLRDAPLLYGISPAVLPRPPDWGAHLHLSGFWFLDEPDAWSPDPALRAFLERGPAPIYVGFGSMQSEDAAAMSALVLDAIGQTGCRAVVHQGWAGLSAERVPPHVVLIGSVPHAWLLPRVALAVHHGGAGTTAAVLRAGIPSVVVPFHGDQPFWGERVRALGVGPAPIPRRALSAPRLAAAIAAAMSDEGMRARAATLGARVRAEDGVARAVELIDAIATSDERPIRA